MNGLTEAPLPDSAPLGRDLESLIPCDLDGPLHQAHDFFVAVARERALGCSLEVLQSLPIVVGLGPVVSEGRQVGRKIIRVVRLVPERDRAVELTSLCVGHQPIGHFLGDDVLEQVGDGRGALQEREIRVEEGL